MADAIVKDRYHALNSHAWDDYTPPPMGKAVTEDFQRRLNELAGVEPDGGPRLKLSWAPDCEEWNVYHKRPMVPQWAFWKAVTDGVEPLSEGSIVLVPKWRYVAAPRYAILGRVPPESRWGDTRDRSFYEKGETFLDEDGTSYQEGGTSVEEVQIPIAWKMLFLIEEHDTQDVEGTPLCCLRRAHEHRTRCFGRFRKPDDYDLKYIAKKLALSAKLFEAAPHERLTQKDRLNLISGKIEEMMREQAAIDAEADYISQSVDNDDWFKRPNDSVKGKLSIPGV
jgi:hypothetical protein